MNLYEGSTSPPSDWTIAVFAKKTDFKEKVVDIISEHVLAEKGTLKVIPTPDVFDEQCLCPDQQIIDFMAQSLPGPNLFILAIDSENCKEEDVVVQITKLQQTIGQNVTAQLAVVTENISIYTSLTRVKAAFKSIHLATISEDLAGKCHKWSSGPFQYDYTNYSADVVRRRKGELECNRSDCRPSHHQWVARNNFPSTPQYTVAVPASAPSEHPSIHSFSTADTSAGLRGGWSQSQLSMGERQGTSWTGRQSIAGPSDYNKALNNYDDCFNLVLLGHTGTGKSASANTILTYGNTHIKSKNLLQSEPSSMPITTECNSILVQKFKKNIRVVDTPDFFNDHIKNPQVHIDECKKYCQPGQCMVLLVFQLGRFTDGEAQILEKLEETFGWKIRKSAVVLLTHGESFEGHPENFIGERSTLKKTVEACGNRYHVFRNTNNDPKQVIELMRKFPNYQEIFPKLKEKTANNGKKNECSLC